MLSISIHTLTQRVTAAKVHEYDLDNISIHTLTQRVTLYGYGVKNSVWNFNPHPHAEGDQFQI